MKTFRFSVVVILAIAVSAVAHADTLVLRRGDTLQGSLVRIADGALSFRTNFAGSMIVPVDQVSSLISTSSATVWLSDGTRVSGRVEFSNASVNIEQDYGTSRTIAFENVASVVSNTSPQKSLKISRSRSTEPPDSSFAAGALWRSGTGNHVEPFAKLTIRYVGRWFQSTSSVLVGGANADDFPEWFLAGTEWALAKGGLYPYVGLGFERDTEKGLDVRADAFAGIGMRLSDSANQTLTGSVGIDAEISSVDADRLWNIEHEVPALAFLETFKDVPRDHQRINLRLGLRYRRAFFGSGEVAQQFLLYPSLTNSGRLRARSESSVMFPMALQLKLKLNFLVDYEGQPEFRGIDPWRTSFGASVFWDF